MDKKTAPGHVYHRRIGSGIEWQPGVARLWQDGRVVAQAGHAAPSAYAFFHGLEFARVFPQVAYWYFRSAWQGRVKIGPCQGRLEDTIYGYMHFDRDDAPAQLWTAVDQATVGVWLPFPPGHVEPFNLPLRRCLAELLLGVLDGRLPAGVWLAAGSLVRRDETVAGDELLTLQEAFPTRRDELRAPIPHRLTALASGDDRPVGSVERRYRFEDALDLPLRDLLCALQGLDPLGGA